MSDDRFDGRLRQLAAVVEWPPTPDLAAGIGDRLTVPVSVARAWWSRPRLALVAAIALSVALVLTAVPPAREVIAGWLGLTHVTVKRVPVLPSAVPTGSSAGSLTRVTLAEARTTVAFPVRVPAAPTRAIYLVAGPPGGEVQFELLDGTFVTESSGRFDERILGKVIGPGTDVTAASVRGHAGAWIHGLPHAVVYTDGAGEFRLETLRLAGNVLIWEEGGVVLRVEGAPTEGSAIQIAAGLR